jgi:hypothetical protein
MTTDPKSNPQGCASEARSARPVSVQDRAAFEAWISAPPYELTIERFPENPNQAWSGQYHTSSVQLAWESWQRALAQHPAPESVVDATSTGSTGATTTTGSDTSDVPAGDLDRLDWIEDFAHFLGWDDDGNRIVIRANDGAQGTGETFREAIDAARHAPDADDDEHSTPPTSDTRGMG